ncbi:Glutathione transport system permease protein GsiD [Microbacterium oxydans]|uniref:Glutathione transport system permease protein GsiD n=1 Tax=Microbacterium oxydans TaxID=82380 RepID=A0A0F0LPI5_9MICO|nr:ABC transporter permease [Microbacterium oxydans]KJL34604.1 Glutathione transport system permease protein GsiD [Microbacterium oxydans]CAH0265177.1 Glutathione transport system permease protein GsiD [Microbacterium oxydans]
MSGGVVAEAVAPRATVVRWRGWVRLAADVGTLLCALVLVLFVLAALWPQLLTGQDPLAADRALILSPPSPAHLLGTDEIGRDVLARIIHGARSSLVLGFGAVLISLVFGTVLGLVAGLSNRVISTITLRLTDIGAAFPELVLAILILALFGGGLATATIAIGIAGIPYYVRVVRGETLRVRTSTYIEASRSMGLSGQAVLGRHLLPNAVRPVVVIATIGLGGATLAGAALSFLGLGSPPPTPEWGSMLSNARNFLTLGWWAAVFPGLAITLFVISTTVLGRRLQARLEGRG